MSTQQTVLIADGAEADGVSVDVDSLVSMNMWGLTPDFLTTLEEGFKEFFEKEVQIIFSSRMMEMKIKVTITSNFLIF